MEEDLHGYDTTVAGYYVIRILSSRCCFAGERLCPKEGLCTVCTM